MASMSCLKIAAGANFTSTRDFTMSDLLRQYLKESQAKRIECACYITYLNEPRGKAAVVLHLGHHQRAHLEHTMVKPFL